jgi:hypothetical protein
MPAKPKAAGAAALRRFEVLTRRPDGHETVHRTTTADERSAREHVVSLGIPREQIVEVRDVGAG